VQRWTNTSRTDSTREHAALLKLIPPEKLPAVIHNQLDGDMLSGIVAAIRHEMLPCGKVNKLLSMHLECSLCTAGQYQESAQILGHLSKVPRFRTIAMFLGKQERKGMACS
jgi:hypothetical protein